MVQVSIIWTIHSSQSKDTGAVHYHVVKGVGPRAGYWGTLGSLREYQGRIGSAASY